MTDSIVCLSAHEWSEVQNILKDLPINSPEFEITITKRNELGFTVQFKNLNCTIAKRRLSKINPVGLHDLFW
jgi:hypothetical protein